jgi:hypothetical protein
MLREIIKNNVAKRPFESSADYYRRLNRIEEALRNKIKEGIVTVIGSIICALAIAAALMYWAAQPYEAPVRNSEYVNEYETPDVDKWHYAE